MKVFDATRDCASATDEEKATSGVARRARQGLRAAAEGSLELRRLQERRAPGRSSTAVKWHAKFKDGKDSASAGTTAGASSTARRLHAHDDEDAGADVYELTQNLTRSFDLRYPWSYFRRGDREWNDAFLSQAVASNYFGRLRAYHWQIALDLARASERRPRERRRRPTLRHGAGRHLLLHAARGAHAGARRLQRRTRRSRTGTQVGLRPRTIEDHRRRDDERLQPRRRRRALHRRGLRQRQGRLVGLPELRPPRRLRDRRSRSR